MIFLTTTSAAPGPGTAKPLHHSAGERIGTTDRRHPRPPVGTLHPGGPRAAGRTRSDLTLHQNAQRLLEPKRVLIPWANQFTFRRDQTRMRRDYEKYLSLIATITLLHQYQRASEQSTKLPRWPRSTTWPWPTAWPAKCWAKASTICCRKRVSCWCCIDDHVSNRAREEQKPRSESAVHATRTPRGASVGATFRFASTSHAWWNWNTYLAYRTGHGNERNTSCSTTAKAATAAFLLGLIDVA